MYFAIDNDNVVIVDVMTIVNGIQIENNSDIKLCEGSVDESLREKCPKAEFFLVRIFPHSDWIRRFTPLISVFSPNAGKYGPEKTPYFDTFHAVEILVKWSSKMINVDIWARFDYIRTNGILKNMDVGTSDKS